MSFPQLVGKYLMEKEIPHQIRVTKRAKHISLKVDHRGLVIISPKELSQREVDNLFSKHRKWIDKHKDLILITQENRKIQVGSIITLLGQELMIINEDVSGIEIRESKLVVPIGKESEKIIAWLKKEAKKYIIARTFTLAERNGFKYNTITLRDQSTRWGSCSSSGNLNFNWRLSLAPLYVLDYVILHELAHTKEMNHSARFWELVEACMPNYRNAKKWLKENGYMLHLY